MDVLIVGSGAREHALAWAIARSPRCGRLYAAPGNPGIGRLARCLPVGVGDSTALVTAALELRVDLVVVGPEAPLAAGLVDRLQAAGVPAFGPTAAAARIESSKAFARELMTRHGVPQPSYGRFRDYESAAAHLRELATAGAAGAVVKADGLAAGKGAVVCNTLEAAQAAARRMLLEREFGAAGDQILVEELLVGEEASLLCLTDGEAVVPLLPAQDYKRAEDGDRGTNTGGMGAYAPAPVLSADETRAAVEQVVLPTLAGLREVGAPFRGCLYVGLMKTPAGLMKTAAGLRVIEFNCRFGDPETEVVLPLLESDLLELLHASATGSLAGRSAAWRRGAAVGVVIASGGYPEAYATGYPIAGLDAAADVEGVYVFHAGTALRGDQVVTSGGRVLCVTGVGAGFPEATDRAYAAAEAIRFEGARFRRDIAARVR